MNWKSCVVSVQWILIAALLWQVYEETGSWTVLCLALIWVRIKDLRRAILGKKGADTDA